MYKFSDEGASIGFANVTVHPNSHLNYIEMIHDMVENNQVIQL